MATPTVALDPDVRCSSEAHVRRAGEKSVGTRGEGKGQRSNSIERIKGGVGRGGKGRGLRQGHYSARVGSM